MCGRDFYKRRHQSFNPRAREGRDAADAAIVLETGGFNPRAREGRDIRRGRIDGLSCSCFNPRAREGRDTRADPRDARAIYVSIHAPARGATGYDAPSAKLMAVSIHAPARGATPKMPGVIQLSVFQSTRPRGARPADAAIVLETGGFNPRAREGRDRRIYL